MKLVEKESKNMKVKGLRGKRDMKKQVGNTL